MDDTKKKKQYFINGTIDRFEDGAAIIKTQDGQTLKWPKENLPHDYKAGHAVTLLIKNSENDQAQREQMAKTILNQLLKKD